MRRPRSRKKRKRIALEKERHANKAAEETIIILSEAIYLASKINFYYKLKDLVLQTLVPQPTFKQGGIVTSQPRKHLLDNQERIINPKQ